MKAVIMAGGMGSRLRPLTCNKPKPMVPVLNKPVMEYAVELLKKHHISDIAVTLQYLPEVIKDYFGDGSRYGVNLAYFEEVSPLGTAGSVKNAEDFLDETFVVISGDGITDYNLTQAVEFHRRKGGLVTQVLAKVENPLEYGVVMCDNNDRIIRFLEKPSWGEVFSDTVNTGIYILEPEIFNYFEKDTIFDFSKDLFPKLLEMGRPMYGYVASGYWSDIGSLEQYRQTHFDLLDGLLKINIPGKMLEDGLWVGEGTTLAPGVKIARKPVFIGNSCVIEPGVELGRYSVLGNHSFLGRGASLKRSILWDYSDVEQHAELRGTTVCSHVQIQKGAALFEDSVVGDKSTIGPKAIVKPKIKIWPHKVVEENSIVAESLIWGEVRRKTMFSAKGVTGVANLEISPYMAVRLAVALGSTLPLGAQVAIGSDHHSASQVIKGAFTTGLLAAGVNVSDIGITTTPVARYAVKSLQAKAGVHIRALTSTLGTRLTIEFLDAQGINISKDTERKIENTYLQEDFRRVDAASLGQSKYIPQLADAYRAGLMKVVEADVLKKCRSRILFAYDYQSLNWFIPSFLEQLGCPITTINSADYSLEETCGLVQSGQMSLGVFLSNNADDIVLITSEGEIINGDKLLTLWAYIMFNENRAQAIGVPVTAPSVIEEMAAKMGGKVIRTKIHPRSVMEVSRESYFQPLFDGMYVFLKVLEYIELRALDISRLLQLVPGSYLYKKDVPCPWAEKGMIMRRLIEEAKDTRVELLDGIKVFSEEGWILILPDGEEPVFKIVSEAASQEAAEKLANRYIKIIEKYKTAI